MAPPPPISLFDLLQFLPLFIGKIGRDFLVRVRHDLMNAPARVLPYLLELSSRFVDDWRDFGDLLRCQTQLCPKPLLHSVAHSSWTVKLKEKVSGV